MGSAKASEDDGLDLARELDGDEVERRAERHRLEREAAAREHEGHGGGADASHDSVTEHP